MLTRLLAACLSCSALLLLAGAAGRAADPAAPEVTVSSPVAREVADTENFTGRLESPTRVELRARVSGYLDKVNFKDGADVKPGEILVEIDPRPYQAELDKADAGLALAETHLKRAEVDFTRAKALIAKSAMTREEYDKIAGEREEAQAGVAVAKASRDAVRLTLSFTKVTAPVAGRISHRAVDAGNLVKADDTVLATISTLDPLHVYFDVDERDFLRLRRAIRDGKLKADGSEMPVAVRLADEEGFPHKARLDFIAGRADPSNGTVRMRAVLPNTDGVLVPGLFVRVRLTTSEPYKALLVPDQGRELDAQSQNWFYVVNEKNVVERRRVSIGQTEGDLRVIKGGLKADDRVIVGEVSLALEGRTVKPVKAPEPSKERPEKPAPRGR